MQVAAPGKTFDDGIARWTLRNAGLFVQDNWKLTKDLTLTAGVRLDQINTPDRPQFNATAALSSAIIMDTTAGGESRLTSAAMGGSTNAP